MLDQLRKEFPTGYALITEFGDKHPDILTTRKCRFYIEKLAALPEPLQRVFRKRFGRWYIHIQSLVDHMEQEDSLVDERIEAA